MLTWIRVSASRIAVPAELHEALDELEFLYDALNDIDRDIAEGLIAQLNHQLERLRSTT